MWYSVVMTKEQRNKYMRDRYAARPEARAYQIERTLARYHAGLWAGMQTQNQRLKQEVLTHYGKDGNLQCCWPECTIKDLDMLSLDHVNDDGAEHRKHIGKGTRMYLWAKRCGFPVGILQTLCHNHQWKKELTRRRKV